MDKLFDVLRAALEMEQLVKEKYLKAAEGVTDSDVMSMLVGLAEEEESHAQAITRYYQMLEQGKSRAEVASDWSTPVPSGERIRQIAEETAGRIPSDTTVIGIYEAAYELELRSVDFYRSAAEAAEDADTVKFLNFLVSAEEVHWDSVRFVLDRMKKPLVSRW